MKHPPEPNEPRTGRKFILGCFGVALLIFLVLTAYIVVGHRQAVGPYDPPKARP